jgi:hypothetical protein
MSHFAVTVIGEEPEKQLAPYHEFECTGVDNEYVQSIDEEARETWKRDDDDSKKPFLEFLQDYLKSGRIGLHGTPGLQRLDPNYERPKITTCLPM